jgi:hypothetical protein
MTVLDQANSILSDTPVSNPALPRPRNTSSRKKKSRGGQELGVAAIFIGTIIAAVYALCQYQLAENTGVLVHASPVGSEVTIEDKSGCVLKTGFIDDKGDLKLSGMKPGTYEVSVSHVGFRTASQDVIVFANKTVAIGIPNTLELEVEEKLPGKTAIDLDEPVKAVSNRKDPVGSIVEQSSAPAESSNQQGQNASQVQPQNAPQLQPQNLQVQLQNTPQVQLQNNTPQVQLQTPQVQLQNAAQSQAQTALAPSTNVIQQPNGGSATGNLQVQPAYQSQTNGQISTLAPASFSPTLPGPPAMRWARFDRMMPRARRSAFDEGF